MRLDIRYQMHFAYDTPIWESQNEIRVRPRSDGLQQVLTRRLVTAPTAKVMAYIDYWGTTVHHVGVREPHLAFEIVAEAAVETSEPPPLTAAPPVGSLFEERFQLGHAQFLAPSNHTRWTPEIEALAVAATRDCVTVPEQVDALVDETRRLVRYQSGSTDIGISLDALVEGGAGVCQDFAHLNIGLARSIGIPARYVSGYLFAQDETVDAETTEAAVSVQTHAWVEVAVPGHGWYAIDPTNGGLVADKHAVIGHGRDYDDVAPVRGVYVGTATPTVQAEVLIARMEPAVRTVIPDGPRRLAEAELLVHQQQSQQQ